MEDWKDVESYLRAGLIYQKEDKRPPLVIVSIDPRFNGKDVKFYEFRVDKSVIGQCYKENLYDTMHLIKGIYNKNGKAVLFE